MKKTLRVLLIFLAIAIVLGAAAGVAAWFFPQVLINAAARAARPHDIVLSAKAGGNPALGWTFDDFSISAPAFEASATHLVVNLDWRSTIAGRPALDALWADDLRATVRASTAPAEESTGYISLSPVHDLRVKNGSFTYEKPGSDAVMVSRIDLRSSIEPRRVTIDSVAATIQERSLTGSGTVDLAPLVVDLHVEMAGPMVVKADVKGDDRLWQVNATGTKEASHLDADATFDLVNEKWTAKLVAAGVPAETVPGLPKSLGALSGTLDAAGTGKSPETLTGAGKLALVATNGPRVNGDLAVSRGDATASVAISSGGIDGVAKTRWNLGKKNGQVEADLKLSAKGLRRWLPASADGRLRASVRGPQTALAWNLGADLANVAASGVAIKRLKIQGQGPSLTPPTGKISLDLQDADSGGQKIEKAALVADGRLTKHTFDLSLERQGAGLSGSGTGSLVDGAWASTWKRLDGDLGQNWHLAQPFRLNAGAAGASINGFHWVGESSGVVKLDGGVVDGNARNVRLSAFGMDLEALTKLAGVPLPIAGLAALDASVSGKLISPEAAVNAKIDGLSIDARPAGDVSTVMHVKNGRVLIDRFTLAAKGGRLDLDADLPLSLAGKKAPPFRIHIKTDGLNPADIPLPVSDLVFENALLKGDMTISGRASRFSASGQLSFDATRVGQKAKNGLTLKDVRLRLTGDGSSLRVVEASAKGGDGTASITGYVAPAGAELNFNAKDFDIRHTGGVSARFDSEMSMKGPWEAPRIEGKVEITKAEVAPVDEKNDKDKKKEEVPPAPAAQEGASPLAIDVAVKFDRNVWYRDGQSAIELKGDLDIRKEPGAETLIFGTIETLRGSYVFYGRSFDITTGRVTFDGKAPPDPILAVSAAYTNEANNTKVMIDATGTLRDPRIALSSQPPMEETDIISVLVTGSPRGSGQSAGGEAVARNLAANYLAEKVRQQFQSTLRIDVLKFNLGEGGTGDVTIGDRVTDDLYISYGQSLGADAERRVNAEYELTPRFSLQGATTNVGRYVLDLLFRFGFY